MESLDLQSRVERKCHALKEYLVEKGTGSKFKIRKIKLKSWLKKIVDKYPNAVTLVAAHDLYHIDDYLTATAFQRQFSVFYALKYSYLLQLIDNVYEDVYKLEGRSWQAPVGPYFYLKAMGLSILIRHLMREGWTMPREIRVGLWIIDNNLREAGQRVIFTRFWMIRQRA
jgi:hypothetical protein